MTLKLSVHLLQQTIPLLLNKGENYEKLNFPITTLSKGKTDGVDKLESRDFPLQFGNYIITQ